MVEISLSVELFLEDFLLGGEGGIGGGLGMFGEDFEGAEEDLCVDDLWVGEDIWVDLCDKDLCDKDLCDKDLCDEDICDVDICDKDLCVVEDLWVEEKLGEACLEEGLGDSRLDMPAEDFVAWTAEGADFLTLPKTWVGG